MYIPIGGDFSVRARTVIGVFDLDNASWSYKTREFLRRAEETGEVIAVTDDVPRAFVLTEEFGMRRIYLTAVSSSAIEKRMRRR